MLIHWSESNGTSFYILGLCPAIETSYAFRPSQSIILLPIAIIQAAATSIKVGVVVDVHDSLLYERQEFFRFFMYLSSKIIR
jgi:hypothetical protein